MVESGDKVYNLFYQNGMGYRMYLATYATRKKAEDARVRLAKRKTCPYKKSMLLVRVGKCYDGTKKAI